MEETAEKNRKLREQMEKDEREEVNIEEKYACWTALSDYNLSPKNANKYNGLFYPTSLRSQNPVATLTTSTKWQSS
jgi:hypothetical protein